MWIKNTSVQAKYELTSSECSTTVTMVVEVCQCSDSIHMHITDGERKESTDVN